MATGLATARRIHIVGGSGSGKSTLALRLAADRSLPVHDLDRLTYVHDESTTKRPLADRLADMHQIASQPDWVTEGKFLWWTDELFRRAEVIIWLDLSWQREAWRVIRRFVHLHLAGYHFYSVSWLLHALYRVRRYHTRKPPCGIPDPDGAVSRAATEECLKPYRSKVIHCRHPAAVAIAETGIIAGGLAQRCSI